VPTDRCSESRDDRRSPLHLDLIASLHEQCSLGKLVHRVLFARIGQLDDNAD
jgi:hypothetical protein